MLKELLKPEIEEAIRNKDWRVLKELISMWPPPDIADLLESLKDEERLVLFRLLPTDLAVEVFIELEREVQVHLVKNLSGEKMKEILLEVPPDDRTEIFEELPGEIVSQLISLLPPEERREALELLGYPKDSVGRLMTPDYVKVKEHWTIKYSLEHIRKFGKDAETLNILYVVDDEGRLIGEVHLRRLVLAEPSQKISEIMEKDFIAINAYEDQEEAARMMRRYDLIALPVVDKRNILLGIVTVDDILDVYEEEATEDLHKRAGVIPLKFSYTATPIISLFKKRIVWLSLLAIAGFLSSSIIASFEGLLHKIIALSFFIPVLIDTGGNTSSQSATLIVRAIALGELDFKKWWQIVKKEILVGVLLGLGLFVLLFGYSFLLRRDIRISFVVGLAVLAICIWANLIGTILPIILTKLKQDPAIISSPVLTTILDFTGLAIYFTIAYLILK
ncbi:MAG: magnesium transporter [candidate division WOR-3 bacterium]|nr:magnesium transporter [candidate division WOR-3 bacterium]MCX7837406.1 magnesium transporter [candidate division WOR-3 bacterium]MDW8113628.1 magnesium transporter [candidate division WOR-3 bacterium]